jgi:flagellar basal-body rod protein FlgB
MFEELNVIKVASAMARHAAVRHRVIAENVANADTPGYRARDVQEFSSYVNEAFTPRATRAGHLGAQAVQNAAFRPDQFKDPAIEASANGNSVSIETEMLRAVEAQGQHSRATAIYSKVRDIVRLSLGRG